MEYWKKIYKTIYDYDENYYIPYKDGLIILIIEKTKIRANNNIRIIYSDNRTILFGKITSKCQICRATSQCYINARTNMIMCKDCARSYTLLKHNINDMIPYKNMYLVRDPISYIDGIMVRDYVYLLRKVCIPRVDYFSYRVFRIFCGLCSKHITHKNGLCIYCDNYVKNRTIEAGLEKLMLINMMLHNRCIDDICNIIRPLWFNITYLYLDD